MDEQTDSSSESFTNGKIGDDDFHVLPLIPEHVKDLLKSGLSAATARELKIRSIVGPEIASHLSFHDRRITSLLCLPYPTHPGFCRDKIFPPDLKGKDGHGMRYLQRKDSGCRLYIPPLAQQVLSDSTTPLYFTEGEKKAAKACQEGYACIGLGGLWNFGKDGKLLTEFDTIALTGRHVTLIPDSEVWVSRPDLLVPVSRLGRLLQQRGAKVDALILPSQEDRQ